MTTTETTADPTTEIRKALARLDRARSKPERRLARAALEEACEEYVTRPTTNRYGRALDITPARTIGNLNPNPNAVKTHRPRPPGLEQAAIDAAFQIARLTPINPNHTPDRPDLLRRQKGTA